MMAMSRPQCIASVLNLKCPIPKSDLDFWRSTLYFLHLHFDENFRWFWRSGIHLKGTLWPSWARKFNFERTFLDSAYCIMMMMFYSCTSVYYCWHYLRLSTYQNDQQDYCYYHDLHLMQFHSNSFHLIGHPWSGGDSKKGGWNRASIRTFFLINVQCFRCSHSKRTKHT